MSLSKEEFREKLVSYFVETYGLDEDELQANKPIFTSGRLDSLEAVNLIAFLDRDLGVRLNPLDVNFERLDTVDAILDLAIQ